MAADPTRAVTGDAAALVEAAERLWPVPGTARVVRRGEAAGGLAREYLLVPSASRPRALLPAGQRRAAAAVAGRASSLTSRRQRAIRMAVAAAARVGLADRIVTDRLQILTDSGGDDIEHALAELLGEPVVVSLGVGTARANRKPILQVLSARGRTLAYVKVGDREAACRLVDGEAATLGRLRAHGFDRFAVPEVLHHGSWHDLRLLVLAPLGGRTSVTAPAPVAAMAELARAGGTTTGPARTLDLWSRLTAGVEGRLAGVAEHLDRRWGSATVECGWSHGDWTPWNMATAGGRAQVWDWERFETSAVVGTDAFHYRMQQVAQRTGDWDAALAALDADAAALYGALGAPGDPRAAVDLYLADLARRYVEAVAGPLGEHLRPRAEWLLDVLERRVAP